MMRSVCSWPVARASLTSARTHSITHATRRRPTLPLVSAPRARHALAPASTPRPSLLDLVGAHPAFRPLRLQLLTRAGLLLCTLGVARALEQRQRLYQTHARLGALRAALAEDACCHDDDGIDDVEADDTLLEHVNVTNAIAGATVPGDLLQLLDLGWRRLAPEHVAATLAQLAELAGAHAKAREAVAAHPAVVACVRETLPEHFGTLGSLATYLRACGTLQLQVPRLRCFVDRCASMVRAISASDSNERGLVVLVEALAALSWRDDALCRTLANTILRKVRAYTVDELGQAVCALGALGVWHADLLVGVSERLRGVSKAGAIGPLVDVYAAWIGRGDVAPALARTVLHNMDIVLGRANDVRDLSTGQLVAVFSTYASAQHRGSRTLARVVDELHMRTSALTVGQRSDLQRSVGSVLRLMNDMRHNPHPTHAKSNHKLVVSLRRLGKSMAHDMNWNTAAPGQLAAAAWMLAAMERWDADAFARIAHACAQHVEQLTLKELHMVGTALALSHTQGGLAVERHALSCVRQALYTKLQSADDRISRRQLMEVSLALNKARVRSLDKELVWAGKHSPDARRPTACQPDAIVATAAPLSAADVQHQAGASHDIAQEPQSRQSRAQAQRSLAQAEASRVQAQAQSALEQQAHHQSQPRKQAERAQQPQPQRRPAPQAPFVYPSPVLTCPLSSPSEEDYHRIAPISWDVSLRAMAA